MDLRFKVVHYARHAQHAQFQLSHPEKLKYNDSVAMNSKKVTYADVLKNPSAFLNPGLEPRPLIPKATRVRLSEDAKKKLREAIHDESSSASTETEPKRQKGGKVVKPKQASLKETVPKLNYYNMKTLVLW